LAQAASNRGSEYLSASFRRTIQLLKPCCSTFYFAKGEDGFHGNRCVWANAFTPKDEAGSIPLGILLVILRHINKATGA